MRRVALALALVCGTGAHALDITAARYADPTDRYAHGVLGDAIEWGTLEMEGTDGRLYRMILPDSRVFEDVAPRLFDVDGDGQLEVIAVEADAARGARLSIYDTTGLVSSSDYIGRSFRWLAPVGVGAADLDGDGVVELAFVDRPHLARTLRIYRYQNNALDLVASLPGVTNHRIGEEDIAGGMRTCGDRIEMIVARADWARVLAVSFDGSEFETRDVGPHTGRESFAEALRCD